MNLRNLLDAELDRDIREAMGAACDDLKAAMVATDDAKAEVQVLERAEAAFQLATGIQMLRNSKRAAAQ